MNDRARILAAVTRMTRAGCSGAEIATVLGIHKATVWRMRRELHITGRVNRRWTHTELRHAAELFNDGCSLKEVARTLGRPISSVHKRFPGRGWTSAQAKEHQRAIRDFEKPDRLDGRKVVNVVPIGRYRRSGSSRT